jgi:hypothetical protein
MTHEQFRRAARRFSFRAHLAICIVLLLSVAATFLLADHIRPLLDALDARVHIHGEIVAGLFRGIAGSALLLPVLFGPLYIVLLLFERRFGLRCPHCGKSLTYRCDPTVVLRSGICRRCGVRLFEIPAESAEGNVRKAKRALYFGSIALTLLAAMVLCASATWPEMATCLREPAILTLVAASVFFWLARR